MAKKLLFNLFMKFIFKFCHITLFLFTANIFAQSDTAFFDTSGQAELKQNVTVTNTDKNLMVDDTTRLSDSTKKSVKKNSYQELLENHFSNKTREELYQEFFGIPAPPKPKEIKALITVNNKRGVSADVVFAEDGENFLISYTPIIEMLTGNVEKELLDSVKAKSDSLGRISNTSLDSLSLFTKLDLGNYHITIFIPPELRTLQEHQLQSIPENPYLYPSTSPSKISGYLNINATQQLKYLQDISFDTSALYSYYGTKSDIRQPLYCNFDGALNVFNAVVEGGFQYNESHKDKLFIRKDVRLVYDIPRSALRLSAGDVYYATSDYQSSISLGGISVSKDYSLTPHVLTYPVGEQEFKLEEQAEVEVWINEVMIKKMVLDPGTHNINNFPFVSGQNEVKIVIRDFSGREETINFSFLYEGQLLAKGISQYSFAAGFPSEQVNNKYHYDDDKPFVSAMYRRGITNQFTLETYGQAFDSAGIFGVEGLHAVPFGNFAFSMAVSALKNSDADIAARLSFQNRTQKKKNDIDDVDDVDDKNWLSRTNWRVRAEYTGKKFKRNSATTDLQTNALRLGLNWSIPLEVLSIGVGSEYTVRRDTTDCFALNVNLNKSWPRKISTHLGFRYVTDSKGNEVNPAITVRAQWAFYKKSNYLSVNQGIDKRKLNNTNEENKNDRMWNYATDFNWNYSSSNSKPQNVNFGVNARLNSDYTDYSANLGFRGNAGAIDINQILAEPGNDYLQHYTKINLRTALVFAENAFALSRPVSSGFLIAKGIKNLRGSKLRINPREKGYGATATWYGPAVMPFSSQYWLYDVKVVPHEASLTLLDEQQNWTLFPRYKSGFLIRAGSENKAFVTGALLGTEQKPFGYQYVKFMEIPDGKKSKQNADTIVTFTNQAGRFQIMGKVGKSYTIDIADWKYKNARIDIPKDADEFFYIDDIVFEETNVEELVIKRDNIKLDSLKVDSLKLIIKEAEEKLKDSFGRFVFVSGVLKNSLGNIKNAVFRVEQTKNKFKAVETFTGSNGEFQFVLKNAGEYRIDVKFLNENNDSVWGGATFNVPSDKMGLSYHLENVNVETDKVKTNNAKADKKSLNLSDKQILVTGIITENGERARFEKFMVSSLANSTIIFTDKNGGFRVICTDSGLHVITKIGTGGKIQKIIRIPELGAQNYDLKILEIRR